MKLIIATIGGMENSMFKLMCWLLTVMCWLLTVMSRLFNAAAAAIVFLMAAALFKECTGTPPWLAGVVLCIAGVSLYVGNVVLIRYYVIKRAPELANEGLWEVTAGTGVVPKWVSFLGLLAIPAFIAAGIWFLKWY